MKRSTKLSPLISSWSHMRKQKKQIERLWIGVIWRIEQKAPSLTKLWDRPSRGGMWKPSWTGQHHLSMISRKLAFLPSRLRGYLQKKRCKLLNQDGIAKPTRSHWAGWCTPVQCTSSHLSFLSRLPWKANVSTNKTNWLVSSNQQTSSISHQTTKVSTGVSLSQTSAALSQTWMAYGLYETRRITNIIDQRWARTYRLKSSLSQSQTKFARGRLLHRRSKAITARLCEEIASYLLRNNHW